MPKKKETGSKKQIQEWKRKAEKWDALNEEICKYYFDKDGNELQEGEEGGDLIDIGEAAARAFGYM